MCSLNVGGLMSKLTYPDFQEFVENFDLVGLSETKLDKIDRPDVNGYMLLNENRTSCKRKSGGVGVLIKNSLVPYPGCHMYNPYQICQMNMRIG